MIDRIQLIPQNTRHGFVQKFLQLYHAFYSAIEYIQHHRIIKWHLDLLPQITKPLAINSKDSIKEKTRLLNVRNNIACRKWRMNKKENLKKLKQELEKLEKHNEELKEEFKHLKNEKEHYLNILSKEL
uniref:BZIP domain-containing protein n=1 Tax=Acrobeloides nanus TaxID=290746 RepID=A0A914CJG5_9BILA